MYIDADSIIKIATLVTAFGSLIGAITAIYRQIDVNKKQSEAINHMQEEQTIICYGLHGALQGLMELGGDGPCKDALSMIDKHLNKAAHKPKF